MLAHYRYSVSGFLGCREPFLFLSFQNLFFRFYSSIYQFSPLIHAIMSKNLMNSINITTPPLVISVVFILTVITGGGVRLMCHCCRCRQSNHIGLFELLNHLCECRCSFVRAYDLGVPTELEYPGEERRACLNDDISYE